MNGVTLTQFDVSLTVIVLIKRDLQSAIRISAPFNGTVPVT